MKNRKINLNRLYLKTITYRLLRVVSNLLLFGLLLGNWTKAVAYNFWLTLLATTQYFVFDYFFNKNKGIIVQTKGYVIWMTGFSGSGKSTIADRLQDKLLQKGYTVQQLDGDVMRKSVSKDLKFTLKDRKINLERAGEIANLLACNNVIVICSFVSPIRKIRKDLRKKIKNFIEIYVNCPLSICEKRDVKGLYKQVRQGKIKNFTGISQVYEKPIHPEIICNTNKETLDESVNKILNYLKENKICS